MHMWATLADILVLLGSALIFGLVFQKLRQNPILGYIISGVILGPSVLNLISNQEIISTVAELGVALLLFMIGLEFSWNRLKAMGTATISCGVLQITFTSLLIAALAAVLGLEIKTSIAIGIVLAPSSTALVLRILTDRGEMESIHGRTTLGVLLLQDLAVVPMIILVSELGKDLSFAGILTGIGRSVLLVALCFTILFLFNKYILPRVISASARARNSEFLLLLAVIISLGSAWAAHMLGVSPGLGAFIAGILLAESPFSVQIRADLGALRVLFMTLFFASLGMLADTGWILSNWLTALIVLISLIAGKALVVWLIAWKLIGSRRNALAAGLSLAQAGEFSFLLAGVALAGGLVDEHLFNLLISTILLSMLIAPFLVTNATSISSLLEKSGLLFMRRSCELDYALDGQDKSSMHILIIGFGPSGRGVWMAAEEAGIPSALIELNPDTVKEARKLGLKVHYGDATREPVLREACIDKASLVVVTLPDPSTSIQVIRQIRAIAPHMPIIARGRYHVYADELSAAGAEIVVNEEQEIGNLLGLEILKLFLENRENS